MSCGLIIKSVHEYDSVMIRGMFKYPKNKFDFSGSIELCCDAWTSFPRKVHNTLGICIVSVLDTPECTVDQEKAEVKFENVKLKTLILFNKLDYF